MGFFDSAKKIGGSFSTTGIASWKSSLSTGSASMKGASLEMQAAWRSLPEHKKAQLQKTMRDQDKDGVPDKFDSHPRDPRKH